MKKIKLINLILLFALSFSALHAFAIDVLDSNVHVAEYVSEISGEDENHDSKSICQIHHIFHTLFILPQNISLISEIKTLKVVLKSDKKYNFSDSQKFFKPPIS